MVYFVSDIHLGAGSPEVQRRVEDRFVAFLRSIEDSATTLILAGDIFDFWFEYKHAIPQGYSRTLGQLATMHDKGIRIIMFTGNHDMWVGDYLTRECGIEIFTTPQRLTLAGKRLFVAHGDNMNIKGQPLLRLMNAMVRSRLLRWAASWFIHPNIFLGFGKWWSSKSRKSHGAVQSKDILNPLIEYAIEEGKRQEIDYFIFGHLHYAADISAEERILFLGDWHRQPSYIVLDDNGEIELKFIEG